MAARRPPRSARSSTTGTVRSALAKPPAPVVSWPIVPKRGGRVSSTQARRLAADAQLDEDEVGAVERGIAIARQDEPAGPAEPLEHPPGEPADDLEPLGIDVEQDELVDRQAVGAAGDALDQLGRVGAAAADDRELDAHPRLRLPDPDCAGP